MFSKKIIIACYSNSSRIRLNRILFEYGLNSIEINKFKEVASIESDKIALAVVLIKNGFETDDLIIISEQDLFGEKILKTSNDTANLEKILKEQNNLNINDLVVHKDYGLGKFTGLETISLEALKNDYLKIEYANDSSLFIPIEDFDLITKYSEYDENISLDNLGSDSWNNKKKKVKSKLECIAKELIKMASLRKMSKAPILIPNESEYKEFCARFKYNETKDQLKAISDIEDDFIKGIPADRLVCGDVGFGKTEVALRAAFIASNAEKNHVQVALIAPTTLLCKQHYNLFKERFKFTKTNITMISRFVKPSENKKNKDNLKSGKIDIVIGTHALLSNNIEFKNLGLLIVDEEQRFGVKQKEKLKEISNGIHVLNLSATPIPRTLQMSMTGIKELSLITTPPVDRLNINTYVMEFDDMVIKEAINRELKRSGKVIVVVPRISDVPQLEAKLSKSLKNIKYNTAHGQMKTADLDSIINDFYYGKFSVLIATTIVESGLDIPEANTIIIYKANKFGLSQLHQLRGRVGRGKKRAYAYLTINSTDKISENAKKRLKAIESVQDIGGGFALANDDMEIRGSGNIIGQEQSGHIKDIGVELYNQMLVETVNKIKNTNNFNTQEYDFSPQVKLNISTTIDKNYIQDIVLRLAYYRKLADIKNEEESNNIVLEIESRFGKVPMEIYNIIKITKIKNLCKKCGIVKLELKNKCIEINFYNNEFKNPDYLFKLINDKRAKMINQRTLSFYVNDSNIFKSIEEILKELFESQFIL